MWYGLKSYHCCRAQDLTLQNMGKESYAITTKWQGNQTKAHINMSTCLYWNLKWDTMMPYNPHPPIKPGMGEPTIWPHSQTWAQNCQHNTGQLHVHIQNKNSWIAKNTLNRSVILTSLIARFMGPTWGPSGADRTQVGPMLAQWTLLSGIIWALL